MITMLFSLLALLFVALATDAPVSLNYLWIVLPIGEMSLFCLGLGLFLAQAAVFFRDIQYIYSVVLTAWMYLTPIFYPINMLPEPLRFGITRLNPMYYYLEQFRQIVMYGMLPGWKLAAYGLVVAIAAVVIGAWSFQKTQDHFILYV